MLFDHINPINPMSFIVALACVRLMYWHRCLHESPIIDSSVDSTVDLTVDLIVDLRSNMQDRLEFFVL